MVKQSRRLFGWLLAVVFALPCALQAQNTRLSASIDRETIRANESFTYILRAEGVLGGRPDISALGRDFDILQSSESTRVQIRNGLASQVGEWLVALMPRAPGRYELPPITLNGVQSNPVTLEILPAADPTGAGAGDIFIETAIDRPVS
jgi:hypothetical protein